ncbi:hypothetical protein NODU109028_02815 [Nocardioides dubius]
MKDVLKGIGDSFGAGDRWMIFQDLVYPATEHVEAQDLQRISGVTTFAEWFNFSMELFAPRTSLDVSVAHNKFKHGLGVRVRDDYLVTFTTSGPAEDGKLPLSAVTGPHAVNLFDKTVLQFLARPGRLKQGMGLESTTLQLNPTVLLAQAALIAHTYAAMFCVAAHEHFEGRDDVDEFRLAPYPGLLLDGPLPQHITRENDVLAMRQALTLRRDGTAPREAMIFYADGSWQPITFTGPVSSGHIVDD